MVVFPVNEVQLTGNGAAVLMPTSAAIRQVAGGEYSFTMEHPIDPWGKWQYLVREAVVRLPVPTETIPAASVGYDTDVYVTNQSAELREEPRGPETITYPSWSSSGNYSAGSKVTYSNKNYQCNYWNPNSAYTTVPPSSSSWWSQIARTRPGATVLVSLKANTELYLIEEEDENWYKMSTTYGLIGYIEKSKVTYSRHISPEDLQPRVIREQLFRIKEVSVDRKSGIVSVTGNHVSNDLNGVLVKEIDLTNVAPAMAIGRITESFMQNYRGQIATNITEDDYGTYTGAIKRKNGMACLVDPDSGIVPTFDARFTRDNWDLFIMAKESEDPVLRIRYGKNANGIIWKSDSSGLVTRVVPVAKNEAGEDLYLPEEYVESQYVSNYPVIYMEAMTVKGQVGKDDGSGTDTVWTEANLLDEMREKAGERFSVDKADIPKTEVTVQLELLGATAEYTWLRNQENVVLYDIVNVADTAIGLNVNLTVQEIEFDCIRKKITGIKLSNNIYGKDRTVAGYNIMNGTLTENKLAGGVRDRIVSDAVADVLTIIES